MTASMFHALEEEETNQALIMKGKGIDLSEDDMDVVNLENQPLFDAVPNHKILVLRKVLHAHASHLKEVN